MICFFPFEYEAARLEGEAEGAWKVAYIVKVSLTVKQWGKESDCFPGQIQRDSLHWWLSF